MKIVHCLLFLLASSFCCEGAARHSEPHVLPVSFHIGTGSKSALWGLKHWPWRAAPAPTTDGNPPANPSSSRAHHYISVTSSSEQGFRNAPRPPSLFSCTPSSRETWCFLPANFHFKDFPQNRPHGPALDWWQGGTQCFQMSVKVKTLGDGAIFCRHAAKTRGKYSWPDFKSWMRWGWTVTPRAHCNLGQ